MLLQNNLGVTFYVVLLLSSKTCDILVTVVISASVLHKIYFRLGLPLDHTGGAHDDPQIHKLAGWRMPPPYFSSYYNIMPAACSTPQPFYTLFF